MLQRLQFHDWVLATDPDETREVYARLDTAGTERCGCEPCFNFAEARDYVYPTDVLDLLEWLGIDVLLESEVTYRGADPVAASHRDPGGWHLYSGWFHLVGHIVEGPQDNFADDGAIESRYLVPAAEGVAIAFSADRRLAPEVFGELPVVELEFEARAPWVIAGGAP